MRILWVKADKLLPVQNGGNIRSYHVLRRLASQHELTFLSYYAGQQDRNYEEELQQELPGAVALCTGDRELSGLARGIDYLTHIGNAAPYAVSRFARDDVRSRIAGWFAEKCFDVAVCDFLDAAVNFPEKLTIPSVLFQHNVESEIWRRHAETERNFVRKRMYIVEFRKMLRYEQEAVRNFHHVIAVSENDRSLMTQWVDGDRITVVPTGVDLSQYSPGPSATESSPLVMFVGAMDWEPNVDGMEFFCREVWPTIQAQVPGARLRIVGRNPGKRTERLACDSIEVTGLVPSVVEHLRESSVVVVPLRIGGGTRLKIYEAMATGKAVVSTTVGAEGLEVHHGEDIMIADGSQVFAQAVIMLLRDRNLRSKFEKAALTTAARCDWPAIGDRFADVLQAVATEKALLVETLAEGIR